MRENLRRIILLSIAVIVACVVGYYFLDIPVLRFFLEERNSTLRNIFGVITPLGLSTPYLVLSALAFLWFRYAHKKIVFSNAALFVFVSVAAAGIANSLFKFVLARCRPTLLISDNLYGFKFFAAGYAYNSFPSGHANTITALLVSLYLVLRGYKFIYVLIALPILLSRVVIGSHYLSDVIFGPYLAFMITLLVKDAFDKHGLKISPDRFIPASPGSSFQENQSASR